jgi:ribosome-associated protein
MTVPPPPASTRVLRVSRSLAVPLDELQWRFSPSGAPGGQHANKASTRAEVRFDVESSPSLGPRQRARLLAELGPVVRVVSREHRSQTMNREEALRRLAARLSAALQSPRVRRPTAPSAASRNRRLDAKRQQGERKRARSWRDRGDDA